jgi:putative ABC transport system substrate-binding protein
MRLIGLAVVLALSLAPLAVEAQQAKVARIGMLLQGSPAPSGTPTTFGRALHDLGYIVGQNVILERRWAYGQNDRFRDLASELVALNPDVIVAETTPGAIAVARATRTIPIVIVNVSDPVGSGLVDSLAHPGRNVTGGTDFGTELAVKALDLVHAAVPNATRLAVLMSDNPVHPFQLREIQSAAKSIGLTVLPTMAKSEGEFEAAFVSMAKNGAGAFIWLGGAPISTPGQVDRIVKLAANRKLPGMYPSSGFTRVGGMMSYGPSNKYLWNVTAGYVAKILKGAKPSDLPVQQPTQFELVINLNTAKALGLTIPQTLLLRADRVIE